MMCGGKCGLCISRGDDYVTCVGICKREFHIKCTEVYKIQSLYDSMKKIKNVVYKCDQCITGDKQILNIFDILMTEFKKVETKNDQQFKCIISRLDKMDVTLSVSKKNVTDEFVKMNESVLESERNIRSELAKVADDIPSDTMKWNDVVKRKKIKKKIDPVVIIKPINKAYERDNIKKTLCKNVDPTKFNLKGMSNVADNGIVIRCNDEESQEKLIIEAKKNLGDDIAVSKPKKIQPRIKIIRVKNPDDCDDKFIKQLKLQNPSISNAELRVVKREKIYNKGKIDNDKFNMIMEINSEAYHNIMIDNRMKHQWEIYKVVDHISIKRCYNCNGFNHNATNCKKKLSCAQCAGEHKVNECKSSIKKCINCVVRNEKSELNLDVNHNVWDKCCKVYQRKLSVAKLGINYVQ